MGKNNDNGGRASFQAKRAQQVSCLSMIVVYIVLCSEIYATAPESLASLERSSDQDVEDNARTTYVDEKIASEGCRARYVVLVELF